MERNYNLISNGGFSRQKLKLLILQKILLNETDETHSLTGKELISKLEAYGIKAERKTIYDDITSLQESGLDILADKRGHANAYYVGSRTFQDEELYVLADAVASSIFLTKKKSDELIGKLQTLTSKYKAKGLRRNVYVANRTKTFNERIYYNINIIHEAIFSNYQIEFKYYEYSIDKKAQFRHGGELYSVSPYQLIWENDKYYLICYCNKHEKICRYRVDRISDVRLCEDKRRSLTVDENDIVKSLKATYDMYGGDREKVEIEFDNSLINVVIDRFGSNVLINKKDNDRFSIEVDVEISPTFWGWLFTFGTNARVIGPERIVNAAKKRLKEIEGCYKA